jgi:hypothetical protein
MEADDATTGAAKLGSTVHAAEANAAAAAELGGAQPLDGFREQVVDRLQVLTNSLGMSYDMDSTLGEKAGHVLLIFG